MLNFNSILLSSENYKNLVKFYKKVFEKEPDMNDDNYAGFMVGSCFLSIGAHDKIKGKNTNPERVLFNFETNEVQKEFDRIKQIEGVKVIAEPYSMGENNKFWIATFADPVNNFFQLITPWEAQK